MEKYIKTIEFYKGCIESWMKRHECSHDDARKVWSAELEAVSMLSTYDDTLTEGQYQMIQIMLKEC